MAKDTITESELTAAANAFANSPEPTAVGSMRDAFASVGITVVPDPIPEPEGDVIVVDARGIKWVRDDIGMWNRLDRDVPNAWDHVAHYGPVKIYRLEGETK